MLSVVSTPIGNLGDITLRAIDALKKCDAVVCEDTRVTGQLLKLLDLPKKELISYHGHSSENRVPMIIDRLKQGQHLCLVSDAGTPGISDPGAMIVVEAAKERLPMETIPGPAAFLAALMVSGVHMHEFVYLGFLPLKKGRQTLLKSFLEEERTIVFYESVHRIERTLIELSEVLHAQPNRPVVVARELTKMHEEVIRTTVHNLPAIAKHMTKKGEFVVVIGAM